MNGRESRRLRIIPHVPIEKPEALQADHSSPDYSRPDRREVEAVESFRERARSPRPNNTRRIVRLERRRRSPAMGTRTQAPK
jgi:hypothetical protein